MSQQSTSGIPIPKRHQEYDAHMDVNDGTRQGWPSDHRPVLVEFG